MYCVIESPKLVNLPVVDISLIKCIKANRENMFMCIITSNDIMIWFSPTSMLIAFHQRAENSVSIHGENYLVEWKSDSSKIAVMTTKGYLIYYKISFENEFVITDMSYSQNNWNDNAFFSKNQYQNPMLGCKINHEFSIHIQYAQKSLCCFNDEIFVPLQNGKVIKVPWNDKRTDHFFLSLQRTYFQYEPDTDLFKLKENIYVTEFELCETFDGYVGMAAVLSDSNAIYITSDSSNVYKGIVARNNLKNKNCLYKCIAINPLHKILAFGCKNGMVVAFNQPDDYTTLHLSHFYKTDIKEHENSIVVCLKWSPDYKMLCVTYDTGFICFYSVFGSLLYNSKEQLYFNCPSTNQVFNIVRTLDFGIEGYSLWVYLQNIDHTIVGNLVKVKILKASTINNCSMNNIEHILLNGEREIYVNLNLSKMEKITECNPNETRAIKLNPKYQYPSSKLGGNSIWQIINIPLTYIGSNFPIRMSAIDSEGKYLAVAGTRGFTHFSFLTHKWKIFGNADQEKDIKITGGILWWKEFICMSCFNSVDRRDEIRFYSRNSNLDNNYSKISKSSCGILQMNIFKNLLVTFGTDCKLQVMGLEGGKDSTSKIILNRLVEIQIENYISNNPFLVDSIALCPLYVGHFDEQLRKNVESNSSTMKSILVNTSGNLLMFQPDLDSLTSIPEDLNKTKPFSSLPPIIISTSVENFWVISNSQQNPLVNKLMNFSLWLNCGSNGIKVWLPLSGEENEVQQQNRIILTFPLKFYPLSLLINESLFIGATSDIVFTNQCTAYSQIQKNTQLFMPFILEGLLRKKLKADASKIIKGYRYLPYFLHILELLVHKILEEEATSSLSEICDPILSDIVEFLNQFPEYLQIISHCTRKSEVAVWAYLFGIVGNSRNLFEKCIEKNDLETAASYLVVLQNTETLKVCEDLANKLLKACLKNCVWDLIQEIIRFLTSIDPADLENEIFETTSNGNDSQVLNGSISKQDHSFNSKFLKSKNNSVSSNSSLILSPKKFAKEDSFDSAKNDEVFSKTKQKLNKKISFNLNENESLNKKSIESTIYEYGFDLLKSFRIKKLFEMFSNLNGFNIEKWLQQYQSSVLVENFVQALSSLHFDFNWPYPILINELKSTRSFIISETNGKHNGHHPVSLSSPLIKSDFIFENSKDEVQKGSDTNSNVLEDMETESFDLNLVAQELANTGSTQSEKELLFIINTFQSVKCYEWIFLLAIILKNFPILNELIRQLKSTEIASGVAQNIRKGLAELDAWSRNECCGYRSIIEKINNF